MSLPCPSIGHFAFPSLTYQRQLLTQRQLVFLWRKGQEEGHSVLTALEQVLLSVSILLYCFGLVGLGDSFSSFPCLCLLHAGVTGTFVLCTFSPLTCSLLSSLCLLPHLPATHSSFSLHQNRQAEAKHDTAENGKRQVDEWGQDTIRKPSHIPKLNRHGMHSVWQLLLSPLMSFHIRVCCICLFAVAGMACMSGMAWQQRLPLQAGEEEGEDLSVSISVS